MRPNKQSYTPAAALTTGFKEGATGASTTLTATSAGDNLAHLVTITSTANLSAINFTLTGTDPDGKTQTEILAGPNNNTVTSVKYYRTLISVTFSATLGVNTADIGWSAIAVTPTYPLDTQSSSAANAYMDISGTINFTGQQSFANVWEDADYLTSFSAVSAFSAKTADTAGQMAIGATAMRVLINSVTAGATLTIYTSQPTANR